MTLGKDSFLYKTLHGQGADLRRVLDQEWGAAAQAAQLLAGKKRIILAGMGTSYCAAVAGAWMLRAAGADAWPINSFDLAVYPDNFKLSADDAVMILSHSGVKFYSHKLFDMARAAGAAVIAVAGIEAQIEGIEIILRTTPREKTSAYTSSHLCAMAAIAQIATELGTINGSAGTADFRDALAALPAQVDDVLSRGEEIEPFARRSVNRLNYAVGAGPNEASAIEVIIKVREAAFGHVDGMGLEQYLHGPIVSLNAGDGVLLVNCPGQSTDRVNVAAEAVDVIRADMLIIGDAPRKSVDAQIFALPHTSECLSPLLSVLPMQLFAYYMAAANGVNPDRARRDTPKYDAAIAVIIGG